MKYLVDCWIRPRSGFDLREHNMMLSFVRDMFSSFDSENGTDLSEKMEVVDKQHEGMVIHTFTVDLDKKIIDYEKDVLAEIRKNYHEAELITCTYVPKKG